MRKSLIGWPSLAPYIHIHVHYHTTQITYPYHARVVRFITNLFNLERGITVPSTSRNGTQIVLCVLHYVTNSEQYLSGVQNNASLMDFISDNYIFKPSLNYKFIFRKKSCITVVRTTYIYRTVYY